MTFISYDQDPSRWLLAVSYGFWIMYTTGLVVAAASFVHAVSPQAIGRVRPVNSNLPFRVRNS